MSEAAQEYIPFFWRSQEDLPDVYRYDFPSRLRTQLYTLFTEALSAKVDYEGRTKLFQVKTDIVTRLQREIGLEVKNPDKPGGRSSFYQEIILRHPSIPEVLTALEFSMHELESFPKRKFFSRQKLEAYTAELNQRFDQHSVGYQYTGGMIIRRDAEFVHASVTKPVLRLLADPKYAGANEEFLKAHTFYRDRDYKNCLVECGKAFESVLKSICQHRGWTFDPKATASKLIDLVLAKELIPGYLQTHFSGIKNTLADGVPTIRNKKGAHGQGPAPVAVPQSLASYQMHLTATTILYLVEAERELAR